VRACVVCCGSRSSGRRAEAESTLKKLGAEGYRVLGVAMSTVDKQAMDNVAAERWMALVGLAAFLDAPKNGVLTAPIEIFVG